MAASVHEQSVISVAMAGSINVLEDRLMKGPVGVLVIAE
jgi:hypothetical protein